MTSGGGSAALAERLEHSRIGGGSMGYSKAGGETWDRVFGGASSPPPRRGAATAEAADEGGQGHERDRGGLDEFAEGWDRIFGKKK